MLTALFLLKFTPIAEATDWSRCQQRQQTKKAMHGGFHSTGQQSRMHIMWEEASLPRSFHCDENSLTKNVALQEQKYQTERLRKMTDLAVARRLYDSKLQEQQTALVINVSLMMMSRLIDFNWLDKSV